MVSKKNIIVYDESLCKKKKHLVDDPTILNNIETLRKSRICDICSVVHRVNLVGWMDGSTWCPVN